MYPFVNFCDKANFKELKGCDAVFLEKANTLPVSTFLLNRSVPIPIKKKWGGWIFWEFFFSATDAIAVRSTLPSLGAQLRFKDLISRTHRGITCFR